MNKLPIASTEENKNNFVCTQSSNIFFKQYELIKKLSKFDKSTLTQHLIQFNLHSHINKKIAAPSRTRYDHPLKKSPVSKLFVASEPES